MICELCNGRMDHQCALAKKHLDHGRLNACLIRIYDLKVELITIYIATAQPHGARGLLGKEWKTPGDGTAPHLTHSTASALPRPAVAIAVRYPPRRRVPTRRPFKLPSSETASVASSFLPCPSLLR
ncbi:hypothetical protein GUJ93_ZPchr0006g46255 [Zizania palustris]|uniref:Uncharacterized protein n=1 Tax=Zizania palustris TaxID=103762 RepID=A0A8J5VJW9_ZIZPA|nr:hypothetical protein GUJ93_ZPchr0006g46255 [Zizania palustris]